MEAITNLKTFLNKYPKATDVLIDTNEGINHISIRSSDLGIQFLDFKEYEVLFEKLKDLALNVGERKINSRVDIVEMEGFKMRMCKLEYSENYIVFIFRFVA